MPLLQQIPTKVSQAFTKDSVKNIQGSIKHAVSRENISEIMKKAKDIPGNIQGRMPSHKIRQFGNGTVLSKGQKIPVPEKTLTVCTGWDLKNPGPDIDISAFMLDSNGKIISDEWFVFYGQEKSPDGSIVLNTHGTAHDDKSMQVSISGVSPSVSRIVFVLSIDRADEQGFNFSMVKDAYIRILDNNTEILRFSLSDYYETVTSMMLGELYRHNKGWKFGAIGDGMNKDLAGLCVVYGVETE